MASFVLQMFLSTVLGGFAAKWLIPATAGMFVYVRMEPSLVYCLVAALLCFLVNAAARTWITFNGELANRWGKSMDLWRSDKGFKRSVPVALVAIDAVVVNIVANNLGYHDYFAQWLSSLVAAGAIMAIAHALTFLPLVAEVSTRER